MTSRFSGSNSSAIEELLNGGTPILPTFVARSARLIEDPPALAARFTEAAHAV
jgi:hypothetical protein